MLPRSWLGQRMQFDRLKEREFITLVGGVAAAWPIAARAQQPGERVRRIGVLMPHSENDAEFHDYLSAFREGLQKLGVDGRTQHSNRFPLGRARGCGRQATIRKRINRVTA